jgi:hypothetical protein
LDYRPPELNWKKTKLSVDTMAKAEAKIGANGKRSVTLLTKED